MLHHHHARRPALPPILAAALVGYALGAVRTVRLRRQLAAARHAALHDPLTGLPNRRAAIDELRHRLTAGVGSLLAVLDLDPLQRRQRPVRPHHRRRPTNHRRRPALPGHPTARLRRPPRRR